MADPVVTISWRSESLERINKNLNEIEKQLRLRILEKAVYDAGEIVLKAAQARAPVGATGNLRASLGRKRIEGSNWIGVAILARKGKRGWGGEHAHLVERGHRIVIRTRGGLKEVGHYPARPFMRPAIAENRSEVLTAIADNVAKKVNAIRFP